MKQLLIILFILLSTLHPHAKRVKPNIERVETDSGYIIKKTQLGRNRRAESRYKKYPHRINRTVVATHFDSSGMLRKRVISSIYKGIETEKRETVYEKHTQIVTTKYVDSVQYGSVLFSTPNSSNSSTVKKERFFKQNQKIGYTKQYYENGFLENETYIVENREVLSISYYKPNLGFGVMYMVAPDSTKEKIKSESEKRFTLMGGKFDYEKYQKRLTPRIVANDTMYTSFWFQPPFQVNLKRGNIKELIINWGSVNDSFSFSDADTIMPLSVADESLYFGVSKNCCGEYEIEHFGTKVKRNYRTTFQRYYDESGIMSYIRLDGGDGKFLRISFGVDGMISNVKVEAYNRPKEPSTNYHTLLRIGIEVVLLFSIGVVVSLRRKKK